jgi:hypothetical protein
MMNKVILVKVGCGVLAIELSTIVGMSVDKPEINLPPNYYEPHEMPSNDSVPQWQNNIIVSSTTNVGTASSLSYNAF